MAKTRETRGWQGWSQLRLKGVQVGVGESDQEQGVGPLGGP